jgi:hypothetical protein
MGNINFYEEKIQMDKKQSVTNLGLNPVSEGHTTNSA